MQEKVPESPGKPLVTHVMQFISCIYGNAPLSYLQRDFPENTRYYQLLDIPGIPRMGKSLEFYPECDNMEQIEARITMGHLTIIGMLFIAVIFAAGSGCCSKSWIKYPDMNAPI